MPASLKAKAGEGATLDDVFIELTGGSREDFLAPGILAQSIVFIAIFYGLSAIRARDSGVLATERNLVRAPEDLLSLLSIY